MKINEQDLVSEAILAQQDAICPFSNYPVGAAVITKDGDIIRGFNIESKAYPTTLCAERVAIFSALAQGHREFRAIAVATNDRGTPCGGCRQIMHEYMGDATVLVSDGNMDYYRTTVSELLPTPFG